MLLETNNQTGFALAVALGLPKTTLASDLRGRFYIPTRISPIGDLLPHYLAIADFQLNTIKFVAELISWYPSPPYPFTHSLLLPFTPFHAPCTFHPNWDDGFCTSVTSVHPLRNSVSTG